MMPHETNPAAEKSTVSVQIVPMDCRKLKKRLFASLEKGCETFGAIIFSFL